MFNWVQDIIPGARCLDLYAGSGALGVEALSRGAAGCTFVERHRGVAQQLTRALDDLGLSAGTVVCDDARRFLDGAPTPFDIVFLDPPFGEDILSDLVEKLDRSGWLAPAARVYMECEARREPPALPPGWTLAKSKRAGNVGFHLGLRGDEQMHRDSEEGQQK